MNIPLNISWQQILLHLFNFSILTLGLYILLYNPVKNFMEQRKEYYNKLDKDANDKLNEAKELEITYEKRIADIEKLIEERKASAAQEAKLEAKAILKDAEKKAEKILLDAQQAAQQERAKILEDTQEEITQMAISAVEKLLAQSSSGALNQFLDAVKKE